VERDLTTKEFWDRRAATWERRADSLERMSDVYGTPTIDALAPQRGERVLDIGCGPGSTTVALARRTTDGERGRAVGVDVSPAMIEAARRRADRANVSNIEFMVADAQIDPLGADFDCVYSRFGVMFFADPSAAFTNVLSALRPGGRLACVVWGPIADNPWMSVPTLAAGQALHAELTLPGPDEPGPFSLADPDHVVALLDGAGFTEIVVGSIAGSRLLTDSNVDDEIRALIEVGAVGEAYESADAVARQGAVDAVMAAIQPFRTDDGWRLPGLARMVTARRPE